MSELPKGWVNTQIGQVITLNEKLKGIDDEIECGFVPMALMPTAYRGFVNFETKTWGSCKKGFTQFKDDDVLLAKITPCFENGKGGIVTGLPNGIGAGSTEYFVLRCIDELIQPQYLHAFVKSKKFMDDCEVHMGGSVGHKRVPKDYLLKYEIPLAPLNEQIRITNKLDSILAKVDKAQARLDKIPAILKRFRQSVLAAATSGELTKEWRAENPSATSEPILNELSSFKFDARTKKLVDKEIRPDEISTDLPSGWKWVRLCGITDVVSGVAKGSKTKEETVSLPYLRVANVQRGYLDLSEVKYIDVAQSKGENLKLEKGDVLFNEGGDIDKLGRGWVWEGQIEDCIHQNHVFRARILSNKIQPKYLSFYGNESARDYFLREGTQTVNLANLNKTTLSLLPVPLPPEEEQVEIVRQVDRLLNKANKVEKQYLDAKARLDRLTQSILAKAFRGELVQQDPSDEPAEKLLERILAEKEQRELKKTTRKRTKNAKTAEKE
ncbi:TPA: restriction endonuclease subunit S [Vibrio parahaemolyticus]|uniref:restriction endonuclease subunit S n=1 Tax=Vibrio parahaemolyticus TaxID=670 RepID=UPI00084A878D|nr:restriction endonuclease subunit S [Vibrio parahaemolyticus]OEB81795.1 hypothetical protein BBM86_12205 [Vibrio parahaemolyticus]OHX43489.1 hypothetical protein BB048_16910 [Vibrio parahaemolyticus]